DAQVAEALMLEIEVVPEGERVGALQPAAMGGPAAFFRLTKREHALRLHVAVEQAAGDGVCQFHADFLAGLLFRAALCEVIREGLVQTFTAFVHQDVAVTDRFGEFRPNLLAADGACDFSGVVVRERSEERRVGKECRSRWWYNFYIENQQMM